MTQVPLPPPPRSVADRVLFKWLSTIYARLTTANQILWDQVDKASSALADLEDRSHSVLENVLSVDETSSDATKNKHTSNALAKDSADHQAATNAHGATGSVIGSGNIASTVSVGVVLQATDVAALSQTITNPPTQAEVQAISNKIDELLSSLKTAGTMDT